MWFTEEMRLDKPMSSRPTVRATLSPQLKDGLIDSLINHAMEIEAPPRFTTIYEAVIYFDLLKRFNVPPPSLSSLVPSSAALGSPSFTLHVHGTGFDPASQIIWNGSAEPTEYISDTELTTEVNMDTAQVAIDIPVAVQNGFGVQSAPLTFSLTDVIIVPPPVITSLIPNTIAIGAPDFVLRVLGSNFNGTSVIRLNGTPAPTTLVSPTEVSTPVDMGLVLTPVTAQVTVANGADISNAVPFTVTL